MTRALTLTLVVLALAAGFIAGQAVPRAQVAQAAPQELTERDKADMKLRCYELVRGAPSAAVGTSVANRCLADLGERPLAVPRTEASGLNPGLGLGAGLGLGDGIGLR